MVEIVCSDNILESHTDTTIHVALSPWNLADDYNQHAGVTLYSLLSNCKDKVIVHILYDATLSKGYDGKENINRYKYQEIVDKFNSTIEYHHVQIPDWVSNIPAIKRFTPGSILRLYLPDILPKTVDKVIYLDCDTVVMTDIRILWSVPLDDYCIAACPDKILLSSSSNKRYWRKSQIPDDMYFNSGVLVFNLKAIRHKITIPFVDVMYGYMKAHNNLRWPDQDVLNWFCQGNYLQLDEKYNQFATLDTKNVSYEDGIIHYAIRELKPWRNYHGAVDDYYWNYLRKTPWYITEDDFIKKIRSAPDMHIALSLLNSNFVGCLSGTKKERIIFTIKFTISIWKNVFDSMLIVMRKSIINR